MASTPFQIVFTNNDAGIPHNVAIHEGSPTGPEVWKGEIFNGVETRTYDVPALPAGTYGFVCTVHPNMTGTLGEVAAAGGRAGRGAAFRPAGRAAEFRERPRMHARCPDRSAAHHSSRSCSCSQAPALQPAPALRAAAPSTAPTGAP